MPTHEADDVEPAAAPQEPQEAPEPEEAPETLTVPKDAPGGTQEPASKVPSPDVHGRSPDDLAKGYARPHRDAVVHKQCGNIVVLPGDVSRELAKSPGVLSTLRCVHCRAVRPVSEFTWHGTTGLVVGS